MFDLEDAILWMALGCNPIKVQCGFAARPDEMPGQDLQQTCGQIKARRSDHNKLNFYRFYCERQIQPNSVCAESKVVCHCFKSLSGYRLDHKWSVTQIVQPTFSNTFFKSL